MKEEEARKKWCPFARVTMFIGASSETPAMAVVAQGSNRLLCDDAAINGKIADVIDNTGATRCMGSKCMAWRRNATAPDTGDCGLARP